MKGGVRILGLAVATHTARFTSHSSYNSQTAQSIFVIRRFMHRADIQNSMALCLNIVYGKLCPGHGIIIAHPGQAAPYIHNTKASALGQSGYDVGVING